MTQYKDIPQPSDLRNQSQSDILNNYRYLIDLSAPPAVTGVLPVDHRITGNNTANPSDGFHNQVSFLNRTAPANLTNAINGQNSNAITYTINDANTQSQLHHYNGTDDFQITPCFPVRAAVNFSYLPAAAVSILGTAFNITVGNIVRTGQGLYTITFTNALPSANYYLSVTAMGTATTLTLWGGLQGANLYSTSASTTQVHLAFFNTNGLQDPVSATVILTGG